MCVCSSLVVARCLLLVVSCPLFIDRCSFAGCSLFVVCCLLCFACCLLQCIGCGLVMLLWLLLVGLRFVDRVGVACCSRCSSLFSS